MSSKIKRLLKGQVPIEGLLKGQVFLEDGLLEIYNEEKLPVEALLNLEPEFSFVYDVDVSDGWLVLRGKTLRGKPSEPEVIPWEEYIPATRVRKLQIIRR